MSKTIKVFVFTHNDKPNEFTLGLSSGYIDDPKLDNGDTWRPKKWYRRWL